MNKYSNIFNQILQFLPRVGFERLVQEHEAEKHAKGFRCWDQLVSMLFLQLSKSCSLTEICQGLATCTGKLVHLGLNKAPGKSTLAYANEHRPWELYQSLFYIMLDMCRKKIKPGKKFRFKNKLASFDATTLDLCLSLFDWARFRRTKGAIKLHMVLDHDGYLPTFCAITDGRTGESGVLKSLYFQPGTIVVFDRGCIDFRMFSDWTEDGVFFITREKKGINYTVVDRMETPGSGDIIKDELIEFTGFYSAKKCPDTVRRIVKWEPDKKEKVVFITNNMELSASTIAAAYKDRWQIEIFFKTLKQHLKIKTFVGTSANAVKTQIWTALIAVLILKYMKHISKAGISMSNLAALLRLNLLIYKDLYSWLDDPLGAPQIEPNEIIQMDLFGQHDSRPEIEKAQTRPKRASNMV
jgi:hypothetical protein